MPTNASPTLLPTGNIDTLKWLLPQAGARYKITDSEEVLANAHQNLRQYINYATGGFSPWSLGSQAAFVS